MAVATDLSNSDLEFFRERMRSAVLTPMDLDTTDENLKAFRSHEAFVAWYGQPPAPDGTPYRDRGFYVRELAHVSQVIRPRTVVEFGTAAGIGTCLLAWLNPDASVLTIDRALTMHLPNRTEIPTGYIAQRQYLKNVSCLIGCSWEFDYPNVDLCFIDGDHSYQAVAADSAKAWANRSSDHPWAIIWHDHNVRHPGVMDAVADFCGTHRLTLQQREDSDTVWVKG